MRKRLTSSLAILLLPAAALAMWFSNVQVAELTTIEEASVYDPAYTNLILRYAWNATNVAGQAIDTGFIAPTNNGSWAGTVVSGFVWRAATATSSAYAVFNGGETAESLRHGLVPDNQTSFDWGEDFAFSIGFWAKVSSDASLHYVAFWNRRTASPTCNNYGDAQWSVVIGQRVSFRVVGPRESDPTRYWELLTQTTAGTWPDDEWHFCLITVDQARVRIYIDGVLSVQNASAVLADMDLSIQSASGSCGTQTLRLGWGEESDIWASYAALYGCMDYFVIYNKKLSASEVATIYTNSAPFDGMVGD